MKAAIVERANTSGGRPAHLAAQHCAAIVVVETWLPATMKSVGASMPADEGALGEISIRGSDIDFRYLFDTCSDAIMLLTEKGFFDCNPKTLSMFGCATVQAFVRLHPSDLSPPFQPCGTSSRERAGHHIARAMQTGSDHFEWIHRRFDGADFEADVLLSRFFHMGQPVLQATVRDISPLKQLQRSLANSHDALARAHAEVERKNQELALLCVTDQLTGLFNRRKLDMVIAAESRFVERGRASFAVILADVDHFKKINDKFGHQCGDDVLRMIASLIRDSIRETDVSGRWGGEEFMVVCPETNVEEARKISNRIRETIQDYRFDAVGTTTCSFGVAVFQPGIGIDGAIRRADNALYEAKASGRNRVVAR